MFSRIRRIAALAMATALMACMAPLPGLAAADQDLSAPDDYLLDLKVIRLQALLAAKGFYRGSVNGIMTEHLGEAILTFHKAADLDRTTTLMPGDLLLLSVWEPQIPDLPDQPDRLEVDIERQVMHLVNDGEVTSILPISSGNEAYYRTARARTGWARAVTPRGHFNFYRHIPGWRYATLGGLYKPWYFRGGFAIHGSTSVPAYPASHGCIRVTMDDADWLSERLSIGFAVNVRNTIPRTDPAFALVVASLTDPLGMFSS